MVIKYEADVNAEDRDGEAAPIISAYFGDDVTKQHCPGILKHHSCTTGSRGRSNHPGRSTQHSPLGRCQSDTKEAVELILGKSRDRQANIDNVDANAQGGDAFTAVHAAAAVSNGEVPGLLLDPVAFPNIVPQVDSESRIGTPLRSAILSGSNSNVRILLKGNADPNISAGKHGARLDTRSGQVWWPSCSYRCARPPLLGR